MAINKTKIKNFWDKQADQFGKSPLATAPDIYYRKLEIDRIIGYLKDDKRILDVGCGNGFSMLEFAKKFPKAKIIGVDYSEKMIKFAKKALDKKKSLKNRVKYVVGDVMNLTGNEFFKRYQDKFDYIVSERCLINLENWHEQKRALLEMKKLLKKGGRIILCENTREGLAKLNKVRNGIGLAAISVRWHNFYMPQKKLLDFAGKNFKIIDVINIGSLYYIISRVVYAKLCSIEKKEPDYLNPINMIAARLPSVGDFSPNYIFILKKN